MNKEEIKTVDGLAPTHLMFKIRDGKLVRNEEMIKVWNDRVSKEERKVEQKKEETLEFNAVDIRGYETEFYYSDNKNNAMCESFDKCFKYDDVKAAVNKFREYLQDEEAANNGYISSQDFCEKYNQKELFEKNVYDVYNEIFGEFKELETTSNTHDDFHEYDESELAKGRKRI